MLRYNSERYDQMANRKWNGTAEDNERLKALGEANVSIVRTAAALKRSTASVRAQARKLGTPFPHMKNYQKKLNQPHGVH